MPLFCLLNNWMSAKSTPQILSLNDEYTLRLLNFLITGLCNSLANLTLLIPLPLLFLSKKLIHHTC